MMGRTRTIAIIPSAGSGKRLGKKIDKPFVKLGGKPIIVRTLEAIAASKDIDAMVIAVHRSRIAQAEKLIRRYRVRKVLDIVAGGRMRSDSVRNCVKAIGPGYDIVLVHDAARPFIEAGIIARCIGAAKKFGGSIAAVPVTDTLKLSDAKLRIIRTLDRSRIYRAQTPQAFRIDIIRKAYGGIKRVMATDDSALVELMGRKVKIVAGSYRNFKITTKEDLKLAEVIL